MNNTTKCQTIMFLVKCVIKNFSNFKNKKFLSDKALKIFFQVKNLTFFYKGKFITKKLTYRNPVSETGVAISK